MHRATPSKTSTSLVAPGEEQEEEEEEGESGGRFQNLFPAKAPMHRCFRNGRRQARAFGIPREEPIAGAFEIDPPVRGARPLLCAAFIVVERQSKTSDSSRLAAFNFNRLRGRGT
ncbi:hypothetical protein KM043_009886 [Ampulex compressa]|nr:hypothetical protein KM043_009886 [Ampulex compressa]